MPLRFRKRSELPSDWYDKPPDKNEIPKGLFVIQADAGYKKGIAGIGVIIMTEELEYKPKGQSARCCGPIHAELTSVKKGLQEIRKIKKTIQKIVVYNDNLYAHLFLTGMMEAERDYMVNVLSDIGDLGNELKCHIEFIHTSGRFVKRADKLADRMRKKEERRKLEEIEERVKKVQDRIEKAMGVEIEEVNGEYFAVSASGSGQKYKVILRPRFCECPWWQHNWSNKKDYIIWARALPCKHMCALSEYLRSDVFLDFRKPIERID